MWPSFGITAPLLFGPIWRCPWHVCPCISSGSIANAEGGVRIPSQPKIMKCTSICPERNIIESPYKPHITYTLLTLSNVCPEPSVTAEDPRTWIAFSSLSQHATWPRRRRPKGLELGVQMLCDHGVVSNGHIFLKNHSHSRWDLDFCCTHMPPKAYSPHKCEGRDSD